MQSKLDSIIGPYEESTGANFGPGLAFSFAEAYKGVMKVDGSSYSGRLTSINYKAGESIFLTKVGILGGTFVYGQLEEEKELIIIDEDEITELIDLKNSELFWEQFEKIKLVKPRKFAQYWLILDCRDELAYAEDERMEVIMINTGEHAVSFRLRQTGEQYFVEIHFGSSVGPKLKGLGCAKTKEAFVEFSFDDGTVIKKFNTDMESCQIMNVEITDDLSIFKQAITKMKFSMSKAERSLIIDHEISQNQINLKLDCFTK